MALILFTIITIGVFALIVCKVKNNQSKRTWTPNTPFNDEHTRIT